MLGLRVTSAHRPAGRLSSGSREAFGHLEAEWADLTINDLERHPQPSRILKVPSGEIWPFKLLLAELGQRVQTATEQRSHLLRAHRVAGA
jgi:hypothetical protein